MPFLPLTKILMWHLHSQRTTGKVCSFFSFLRTEAQVFIKSVTPPFFLHPHGFGSISQYFVMSSLKNLHCVASRPQENQNNWITRWFKTCPFLLCVPCIQRDLVPPLNLATCLHSLCCSIFTFGKDVVNLLSSFCCCCLFFFFS